MKRNALLILLCLVCVFTFMKAQNNPKSAFHLQGDLVYIQQINQLINTGQLDSAENYCYALNKMELISSNTFEQAIATISVKKNLNEQAYDIVLKNVDYNVRLNGGGQTPLQMLYDYTFGPTLANDTLLEQISINKVKDFYATYPYAENTSGFKIILLNHKMHKLNAAYEYQLSLLKNKKDSIPLFTAYQNATESIIESFKTLVDDHKGLFSDREIGNPYTSQFYLISEMPHLKDHTYFLPYFTDAFEKKDITANQYVDELLKLESFKNSNSIHLQHCKDSLQAQYFRNISLDRTILVDSLITIITEKWDSAGNKTIDTVEKNRNYIPKSSNPKVYKMLGEN